MSDDPIKWRFPWTTDPAPDPALLAEHEAVADELRFIRSEGIYAWNVAHPGWDPREFFAQAANLLDPVGDERYADEHATAEAERRKFLDNAWAWDDGTHEARPFVYKHPNLP